MPTGQFIFNVMPIVTGDTTATKEIQAAIIALWQAYLRLDAPNYAGHFATDAIRLSERSSGRQAGRAAIQASLPAEWEAFERPKNVIAEKMTVSHAEFSVEGGYATTVYWVEIKGGTLWDYIDQGLVFQAFAKKDGQWQVVHHTDAWSLDYQADIQKPGTDTTVDFEYAYPVKDLARAVKFYTPVLGTPESVTATRASFYLKGARFILETNTWADSAQVRKNLPNGYPLFLVSNLQAEVAHLKQGNVKLLGAPQKIGTDYYCAGLDLDENLFLLWEKNFKTSGATVPTVSGFPVGNSFAQAAQRVIQAWATMDGTTLATAHAPKATWFDNMRVKQRGQERGAQIVPALQTVYWPLYDHGNHGLAVQLTASNVHVRAFGTQQIVSYDLRLNGRGAHPFQDSAYITHVFNNTQHVTQTFIVENNHTNALVLELDYTGAPVQDLDAARRFYIKKLKLGDGYSDESYYGFWSNHAVFGLYEADPDEDHLPQPRKANGYMSFWIHSAQETYAYLKQAGCSFPVIPAINDQSGIDKQPGYTQIVATDSEGSVIIFTEYTGRPR